MTIQVNPISSPRIITVPQADGVSITIQSLVNQIRQWEHDPVNMGYDKLLSASGKEDLGGGALVGITAKLENTKVMFEARGALTTCAIYGGNLVAVNAGGNSMFPIEPSTNVTVQLAQSSSPTLLQDVDIDSIKAKTDNLPSHPASETLVQSVKDTIGTPTSPTIADDLDAIVAEVVSTKGVGWTTETLKKIKELIEESSRSKAHINV